MDTEEVLLMVAESPVTMALHLEGTELLMQVLMEYFILKYLYFLLQAMEPPMLVMELLMPVMVPPKQVRDIFLYST